MAATTIHEWLPCQDIMRIMFIIALIDKYSVHRHTPILLSHALGSGNKRIDGIEET